MRRLQVTAVLACVWIVFAAASFQASESPLSKLMREMTGDMKKLRTAALSGKTFTKWGKSYDRIHTAKASAESKKGEYFEEYAKTFLAQVERTKTANQPATIKPAYNLLVGTCIHCHEKYCPGPISMLRKLSIPQ